MTTTPLDRVHTNPATRARTRERIGLLTEAARRAGSYGANAAHRPVYPAPDAVAALDAFSTPLPLHGRDAREVLAELDAFGSPATTVVNDGRYFGFVTGGTEPASQAAAILAGAWDQNVGGGSPTGQAIDAVACAWVIEALGLPSTAVAAFNGGATVANLTGIITGRDALLARTGWSVAEEGLQGAPRLRVIVGEEVHASALKALRLAGFGEAQIERVPTDARGAVRADAFPTDTDHLTLVLLQAGNVNTGASDPFADIIPRVRERGGWVHVDGAFGLWAAASPSLAHQVAGVELADSWATDAHKWLSVPYDSGLVIVRHGEDLHRAMSGDAPYISFSADAPMNKGIQISQRARAVETWAMLSAHGREGLAEIIDRTCAHARRFADLLGAGGAEVLAPVQLNQVLVAFGDEDATLRTIAAIQADGTCWAGTTVWHGRRAMRISVSDSATTADDVTASAAAMLTCWEAVRSAG